MKRDRFIVVSVLACAALAFGVPSFGQNTPIGLSTSGTAKVDRDGQLLQQLQTTVVDAAYDRVDLEKVIADLREKHNLNIHVSWPALEAAGVRRDRRVEITLKQVTLTTLLDIILREARATDDLSYHVADGVIIISTGDDAREETVLRTYDIADLLESGYAIRRFANTPVLGMALTGREFVGGEEMPESEKARLAGKSGGGGGGGGGSAFGEAGEESGRPSTMERVENIITLLQENLEPEGWRDLGGDAGSLQVFGSTLLISHSARMHQKIAAFLNLLRNARPQSLDAEAMVVRLRADKAAQWRAQIGGSFPRLTAQQAGQLVSNSADSLLFRANTSGFNGQGMFFSALTQRDVLAGMTPVVAQQVSAFAPVGGTTTSGLELIVLPLVTPNSDTLTLDVQMAWVPTTTVTTRPVTINAGEGETTVDQTTRSMRTVSSTNRLALGEAIALSIPAQLSDSGTALEWEDWLIIRVHSPGS